MIRPAPARLAQLVPLAGLVALIGVAAWLIFVPLRSATLGPAEWRWIDARAPWTAGSILAAEDGWWVALPVTLFKLVLAWKGLLMYGQYAALGFAGHVAAVSALYLLARTKTSPTLALGPAVLLLFFGAVSVAVSSAAGLVATIPVALGCLAWVLWDRPAHRVWSDAGGTLALIGALASGPAGLAFAAASLAALLGQRPARRRLLWPALAAAAFAAWQVAYGIGPAGLARPHVGALSNGASEFVASLGAALLGIDLTLAPLALLAIAVAAAMLALIGGRSRTVGAASVGLIVLIATASLGAANSQALNAGLLYAGGALTFLTGAALVGRWAGTERERPGRAVVHAPPVVLAALAVVLAFQVHALVTSVGLEVQGVRLARAELALLDLARPEIPAASNSMPIDEPLFGALTPAAYWRARDALAGAPLSSSAVTGPDAQTGPRLDNLLFRLLGSELRVVPDGAPRSGVVEVPVEVKNFAALLRSEGGCQTYSVPEWHPQLSIRLAASEELYLRSNAQAPTQLFLRSLANDYQEAPWAQLSLGAGQWNRIVPPRLPAGLTWSIRIDPPVDASLVEICVVAPAPPPVALHLEPVVTGLAFPVGVVSAGDGSGRIFVLERAGHIRVISHGKLQPQAFLDISSMVSTDGEQGFLGLAFHPRFQTNGRLFVHYTDLDQNTVIAEYRASPGGTVADPTSGRILLRFKQPTIDHNGGTIGFGPDGYLYIGLGDGTYLYGYQTAGTGQDLSNLLGKILRIDVDHGDPYAIPPDNPFVGRPGARPEIWAYGFRNPWRFSFDRATGDLWIGDVGHRRLEEIDYQPAGSTGGQNYGWDIIEGTECYLAFTCDRAGLVPPLLAYPHELGFRCAVMGGYVYRGTSYPALRGRYLFSDFCSGELLSIDRGGATTHMVELLDTDLVITSLGEDEAGELYVTDVTTGGVYRIVAGT